MKGFEKEISNLYGIEVKEIKEIERYGRVSVFKVISSEGEFLLKR